MLDRTARWLLAQGVKPLSIVPIMFENSAGAFFHWSIRLKPLLKRQFLLELVVLYLAILKIGCCVACINSHLQKGPLLHCLKVSTGNMIIFGSSLSDAIEQVAGEVQSQYFVLGDDYESVTWVCMIVIWIVLPSLLCAQRYANLACFMIDQGNILCFSECLFFRASTRRTSACCETSRFGLVHLY